MEKSTNTVHDYDVSAWCVDGRLFLSRRYNSSIRARTITNLGAWKDPSQHARLQAGLIT